MRLSPLLLVLLALPASAQLRSATPYDGTSPGHPADEPGPELGSSAEDALTLLARGDRDAARLSASRCLRATSRDHGCRVVAAAVEAGVDMPKLPPSGEDRPRAELHFQAGADYYFHDEFAEARREWEACRRLDAGHGFCALGVRLAPGGARAEPARAETAGGRGRQAQQAFLSGMIYYQKGDYERARREWKRCLALRPDAETRTDCDAGLARVVQLFGQ